MNEKFLNRKRNSDSNPFSLSTENLKKSQIQVFYWQFKIFETINWFLKAFNLISY